MLEEVLVDDEEVLQSLPENPTLQAQIPVAVLHEPWPEHELGQVNTGATLQSFPVYPPLQKQTIYLKLKYIYIYD